MRYAATLQTHWDWRAAANFAFGGSGGGLLVASALLASPANLRASIVVLGLGLIGAGLTMVWLEIGRPLRAANVNRRPQTSWMTREAYAAAAVFALGGVWLLLRLPTLWWMTAAAAATFVWCQARILRASKGVPAWREPAVMILIAGTASTEGAALLTLMSLPAPGVTILSACMALLALRWLAWRRYRERLRAADPAAPLIAPLARLDASARRWGLWVPGRCCCCRLRAVRGRASPLRSAQRWSCLRAGT